MLKIRLQRVGRTNNPSFRVVLTESQNSTKSGRYLEVLGHHDYRRDKELQLNADRIKHWLANGAQLTDSMHNLLLKQGIISGKKKNVLPRKSPPKVATEETAKEAAKEVPKEKEAPKEKENTNEVVKE